MTQPDMFEPLVAKGKTLSSALAAAVVQPTAWTNAKLVYELLQDWPDGLTSTEVCTLLKKEKLSIRPRLTDLSKGKYKDTIGVIYKHSSKLRKPMGTEGKCSEHIYIIGELHD